MTRPVLVDDLVSYIEDLERRLVALERSPQLSSASIREGALTILDASGVVRVRVGQDGSDYGVKVYDAAGANPVSLATLAFGIQAAEVAANESTTSTTPTDLATVGPSVAVTVGSSGRMLIILSAHVMNASIGSTTDPVMAYAITGATTRAADVSKALGFRMANINTQLIQKAGAQFIETGLTPGLHTVTAKYATNVGGAGQEAYFQHRKLIVIPY